MEVIAYPYVPATEILAIHKRSRRETINGYGFFVELLSAYKKERPFNSIDRSTHARDSMKWLDDFKKRLVAAGVACSYLVDYRTPREYRTGSFCDEGWLVVLGTGFNKTLHTPLEDGIIERVQEVIGTDKQPSWFRMKGCMYPDPREWNTHVVYKSPSEQSADSSASQRSTQDP